VTSSRQAGTRCLREEGTVVRVSGRQAAVRIHPADNSAACARCSACRPTESGELLLWVDAADLAEGDRVRVQVPLPSPWRGILLVFAAPAAALVAGLAVGSRWEGLQTALDLGPDASGAFLGAALAVLALVVAAMEDRRFRRRHRPRVERLPPHSIGV